MNTKELVATIAAETGQPQTQVAVAVKTLCRTIGAAVRRGDDVEIHGFGSFKRAVRAPRTGRNPRTGESYTSASRKVVKFKAAKALSDAVA